PSRVPGVGEVPAFGGRAVRRLEKFQNECHRIGELLWCVRSLQPSTRGGPEYLPFAAVPVRGREHGGVHVEWRLPAFERSTDRPLDDRAIEGLGSRKMLKVDRVFDAG